MPNFVHDDGRKDAPLVLVGEAPGKNENLRGIPFVGMAGSRLASWLQRVGLTRRRDLYVTNTYPYQPPGNKLEEIPEHERRRWLDGPKGLHDRLAKLTNPVIIIPTGEFALQAIVGKRGITKRRGSIYEYVDRRGRHIKVIPTLHPASTFYMPKWERRCILDWTRIKEDMTFPELRLPVREHYIMPTLGDVKDYVQEARERAVMLFFDIETPRRYSVEQVGVFKNGRPKTKRVRGVRYIACIGFAFGPDFSITIPLTVEYWTTKKTLAVVWECVRELLSLGCVKGASNGWFDQFHLWMNPPAGCTGIKVRHYELDCMAMHHSMIPNDSHSVEYMASVDTREPYWKDEGKGDDHGSPKDWKQYWTYCGKDASVEWELGDCYETRLAQLGRAAFYRDHYQRLLAPILRMSIEGIRTDEQRRKLRFVHEVARCVDLRHQLSALAGDSLFGKKGSLSSQKLCRFLYETLKLPAITKKNKKTGLYTSTADEKAVRKLMLRHPRAMEKPGQLILDHRRHDKLKSFFAEKTADADGRSRASYGFSPESGRFNSKENPMGTGLNHQNIDREARDVYLPDDDHILLERDLSQAEARIVYAYTLDEELVRIARLAPWEYDVHTENAARIFGVPPRKVDKDMRFCGKQFSHATHYGEQGKTAAETLSLHGYTYTSEEAQEKIDIYHDFRPAIRRVFQRNVRKEIMTTKRLVNTWGRALEFEFERIDQSVFRRGYAFRASSEVSHIVNQWGIRPFWRRYRKNSDAKLRQQGHDSLLFSVHPSLAWELSEFLRENLEQPREYMGVELTIPTTVKVGMRWGEDMHEFKKPPTKREFNAVVEELCASAHP